MKLLNLIMILVIIQATIMIYDGLLTPEDPNLESYGDNNTAIWDFAVNPSSWNSTNLLSFFTLLIGAVGAIGIGVYLYTKSDTILFFSIFTMLIAAGSVPITGLYRVFTRNPEMFGCSTADCNLAIIAWALTGGLLGIFYVFSVLEWWSGRTMSSG